MAKPLQSEYDPFYHKYIKLVSEENLSDALDNQFPVIKEFLESLPGEKADFAYAENKWTVKQLLQHMIDTERILVYRALRFSRHDKTPVPGFEESEYAVYYNSSERSMKELVEEFLTLRKANMYFLKALNEDMLKQEGVANNVPVTALALGYIVVGHAYHHLNILKERYLN